MFQILPAIDLRGGQCVRLRQGDYARETVFDHDPAERARQFVAEGAARLHLVDLDGAREGRIVNAAALRAIRRAVSVPCQLGGGLRTQEEIARALHELGMDFAVVGTQALQQPAWFREMADRHPGRLCLGLDARNALVATHGWLETSQVRALDLARRFADLDLAALIYTNIANDGMLQGIDPQTLDDLRALCGTGLPVIASGGVARLADVDALLQLHRAEPSLIGAIVGRALYEGTLSLSEAVQHAASPAASAE